MVLDSYVTISLVFEVESAAQQFNGYEGIAALNLYVRDNEYVCAAPGGARGVKSITHYAPVNSVRLSYNIGDKRYFALKVLAILYSKISSSGYSKIAINPYTFASSDVLGNIL